MSQAPILRATEEAPAIRAVGGLHMMASNKLPYFTVTMESKHLNGAAHDELLALWPDLHPLVVLHLSDINGVPMHAVANGWYWLAGCTKDGLGEKYHGASGRCGLPQERCLAALASHFRIGPDEARSLVDWIDSSRVTDGLPAARAKFAEWVEQQKPRWKAEAEACIKGLELGVFGDEWTSASCV